MGTKEPVLTEEYKKAFLAECDALKGAVNEVAKVNNIDLQNCSPQMSHAVNSTVVHVSMLLEIQALTTELQEIKSALVDMAEIMRFKK